MHIWKISTVVNALHYGIDSFMDIQYAMLYQNCAEGRTGCLGENHKTEEIRGKMGRRVNTILSGD